MPDGDPCRKCSLPASLHRDKRQKFIIGIDGEGYDTPDGRHIYIYLCAADEYGNVVADAYNPEGLSHDECCELILSLPKASLKVGFMFSYDVTKILEDLPELVRYQIMRPELLKKRQCKRCRLQWQSIRSRTCPKCNSRDSREFFSQLQYRGRGYKYFAGSLTISDGYDRKKGAWKRTSQVWDVFKFFQTSFVEALKDWSAGTEQQIERIKGMKDQRGDFDRVDVESIKRYCQEECVLLARMMRKVINAHYDAGIPLKRYEGAGSSASALLHKYEVSSFRGPLHEELPLLLQHAIESAYFGGRFENSLIGTVTTPVYSYDIASAYPYALYFMPCLECGVWTYVTDCATVNPKKTSLFLIHYRVKGMSERKRKRMAWAPLPFRDKDGSICYPVNFEGWGWSSEVLTAKRLWPDLIEILDGWTYQTRCKHRPFGFMPEVYRARVKLGKEKAKPFKLGMNASYGKAAQTVGDDPPFKSLAWAGACTAMTRAMQLEAIGAAKNRWNILSIATDGIFSTEALKLPEPKDTGTSDLPKPLGVWETKDPMPGAHFVKPGLYFGDRSTVKDVRARGIGRKEFFDYRDAIIKALRTWDRKDYNHGVEIKSRRFFSAKSSILCRSDCANCRVSWPGMRPCPQCRSPGHSIIGHMRDKEGNPVYGRWAKRTIKIRLDPRPKRESVNVKDGRAYIRDVGGAVSTPYRKGLTTPQGEAARLLREFLMGQPDYDVSALERLTVAQSRE